MPPELSWDVWGNREELTTMAAEAYGVHAIVASTTNNVHTKALSRQFICMPSLCNGFHTDNVPILKQLLCRQPDAIRLVAQAVVQQQSP